MIIMQQASKVIIGIAMITALQAQMLIWQQEYAFDNPGNMICSDDGHVFVTGEHQGFLYTMKISPNGDTVWTQKTELNPAYDETGKDLVYDQNKSYLYCIGHGYFGGYPGLYLVKYDYANGDTVYTKFITFMSTDEAPLGVELYDNDNKLVVVGYFYDIFYAYEPTIVLINTADGGIIFSGYYPHGAEVEAYFWDVKTDNENNFLVGGKYHEPFSSYPVVGFFIWKINSASLEWIWQKRNLRYQPNPVIYPYWEEGTEEIALDNDGNPVAVGCLVEDWQYFEPMYFWILKHSNPDGDSLWHTNIGYNGKGLSCDVDYFQNVLVCGTLNDQGMIYYLDSLGTEIWNFPPGTKPERIRYYKSNDSLYFYVYSRNVNNVQVRKYLYHAGGVATEESVKNTYSKYFSSPTIFRNDIHLEFVRHSERPLKITLYDVAGRIIAEKSLPYTPSSLTFYNERITRLSSGVYFLSVSSNNKKLGTLKLIKL